MGADTGIEWCDATFNPWSGCQRVSSGCDHCFAEALSKRAPRTFGSWLPGGPRKRTSEDYWKQPLRWNRKAEKEGVRRRVFCASMADVFDNQVDPAWRCDLWDLIWETPHLDWLLLTKRPQNIAKMLPVRTKGALADWGVGWPNVWLGTTVENQEEAERRIPHLLQVPAKLRFLSCEPLLGAVDLSRWLREFDHCLEETDQQSKGEGCVGCDGSGRGDCSAETRTRIGWVICGGESGPKARPMDAVWARGIRDQCEASGVAFFMKQMTKRVPIPEDLLVRGVPHANS